MSRGVFCVLFNPPPTPLIFFFVSVCLSGLNVYINVHNYIADNIYIYTVTSLYIGKYIEPRICLCKRHQTFSKAVSLYFDIPRQQPIASTVSFTVVETYIFRSIFPFHANVNHSLHMMYKTIYSKKKIHVLPMSMNFFT